MVESVVNPFFTSRAFGAGIGNLAAAFLPTPDAEARRANLLSGADFNRARTEQIQGRMRAGRAAGSRLRAGTADPGTLAQVYADVLEGADPSLLSEIPAFVRGYGAAVGVDPGRLADLFVGAGGNFAHTEPGFMRADETDRRGQDVSAATARRGQDITAATTRDVATMREAGLDRRMAPEINPGNVVVVPPDSPLAPRADPQGRIAGPPRPPSLSEARGALVETFLNPPVDEDPAVQERRREILAPSVVGAETRANSGGGRVPLDVGGTDARAIDDQIAMNLPEGTALDDQAAALVRGRAAELYQQTRNLPLAVQQAVREFLAQNPPRTDSSWNPFSSRTFGAPQATAPAAPSAIPSPAQREVGRVYQTPRGPMEWTGTGWRPAS